MAIPVKATQMGFYGTKIRYEGDTFNVEKEEELGSWMERQDAGTSTPDAKASKSKRADTSVPTDDQTVI